MMSSWGLKERHEVPVQETPDQNFIKNNLGILYLKFQFCINFFFIINREPSFYFVSEKIGRKKLEKIRFANFFVNFFSS